MWRIKEVFGFAANLKAEALREFEDPREAAVKLPQPGAPEPRLCAIDIPDAGRGVVGNEG